MNKHYIAYNDEGRILRAGICDEAEFGQQAGPGETVIEGVADLWLDYVTDGAVQPRQVCPVTLDGYTLTGLPVPCAVEIGGESHACDGGEVDLLLPAGEYAVTVSAWPYLPAHLTVTADGLATATEGRQAIIIAPPPVPVPSSISPAQARLALLGVGLLDEVEAAVAAADRVTQIAWSQATSIERDSPTVAGLSAALGLSAAQLDALFIAGAAIRV